MSTKLKNITLVCMTAFFLFGFFIWCIVKPTTLESRSERRLLKTFPACNEQTILSGAFMDEFEDYALDQFPLRDDFRSLKALTSFYVLRQKDNNGIYIKDGFVAKLEYPMNEDSLDYAASRFEEVYNRYIKGKDMKVYLTIVPDKNYFMAEQSGYPSMDYPLFMTMMSEKVQFANFINISSLLELSDYYRTDTHWRQEKILEVARYLGEQMGVSMKGTYTQVEVNDPFYGVYYGQLALPILPDDLYYLENEKMREYTVFDYETDSKIPVYELEKTTGKDPYEMFLSGSKSLLTITNPNATSDKELILFRDSFGSSIGPLLAEAYAKVTLVDIRYINPALLGKFITFENQDVLFLYSTSVLNNSNTIK